jgi:tetratricopeptide (TPR) repeat protein
MLFGKKSPRKKAIALINKAFKAIDRKNYENAKELLEESFNLDNKIPEAHSEYAFVMSILGNIDFAIDHMIKAALLNPNEAKFWTNVAFQYYNDKQYGKALTSTFVAEIVDPTYPSIAQSKQIISQEFPESQQNVEKCRERAKEISNALNTFDDSLPPESGDINHCMDTDNIFSL